jgi:putative DNA primase/helicase
MRSKLLNLLDAGFSVLPLAPRSKRPSVRHGVHDATNQPKSIFTHFENNRDDNVGIATGRRSNLIVLDVDGPMGRRSLRNLERRYGKLPSTVTVKTPNGTHLYFRPRGKRIRNSAGKIAPGIDVRGDDGYIVAPGSINSSGQRYEFAEGRSLSEVGIAKSPKWLLRKAKAGRKDNKGGDVLEVTAEMRPRVVQYCDTAVEREVQRLEKAPVHQRNNTLNLCAFKSGQLLAYGTLSVDKVRARLASAAQLIGLNAAEIDATIESGLRAGKKRSREQ